MRILIDGGSSGSGGYIRYLRGILSSGRVPPNTEVILLCSPEISKILGKLDERVEIFDEPVLSAPRKLTRINWWLRGYPKLVRSLEPDVIFHTSGIKRGYSGNIPSVAVHHSMALFNWEVLKAYGLSRQTLQLLIWRVRHARSYRKVDGVVFLADYTRREVCRQVRGIKRTAIVPNALEDGFRTETPHRRPIDSPIKVLCVSAIYLFRYQWNVVEAIVSLRKELGLDIHLSIVGGGEPIAKAKLARRIKELRAESFTTVTGGIPPNEMPGLYRNADLFVFPSAVEAFPITLLEAMGAGLPIACSERMAMPEILQDGGVYFDPKSPKDIAAAVCRLIGDLELRFACASKAHGYARKYTWDESAEKVYGFLRIISQERRHE